MTRDLYQAIRQQIKGLAVENGKKKEIEMAKQSSCLIQQTQDCEEKNEILMRLDNEYEIELTKKDSVISIKEYIFSSRALWYWLTIFLTGVAAMAIFFIPETDVPLVYLRLGLGVVFVLFLPGFVLMKTLFPAKVPFKTSQGIDKLELVVLSLGMSLTLTPMVVLILNYTPFGVRLASITSSLLTLTVVLATTAVLRELRQENPKENGEVAVEEIV